MSPSVKLPKSWPASVQHIVLAAARYYYQQMNEPFPVSDVAMDNAIEFAVREIEAKQRYIYEEAPSRWIHRWESGQFEADMRKAIEETYGRLRRAERGTRSRPGFKPRSEAKKSGRQLDAEIAESIVGRSR